MKMPEAVAWMFQHDETGRSKCVDAQQVEWGFEANNPRWIKCFGMYSEDQLREALAQQEAVMRQALEALLGADQIDTDMREAIKAIEDALK